MTFGERMKQARKALKMSQASLAEAVGVTQGMVSHLEVGRQGVEQSPEIVAKIETALGLGAGELAQHLPADHPARRMAAVEISVRGVVAAGAARDEPCDDDERLRVSDHFAGCIAYKVRGDSMTGCLIGDGDYVLVRPVADKMPKQGDTVVAWVASLHGHVVKLLGKRATLESPEFTHRLADDDLVLGVLAGVIRYSDRKN